MAATDIERLHEKVDTLATDMAFIKAKLTNGITAAVGEAKERADEAYDMAVKNSATMAQKMTPVGIGGGLVGLAVVVKEILAAI